MVEMHRLDVRQGEQVLSSQHNLSGYTYIYFPVYIYVHLYVHLYLCLSINLFSSVSLHQNIYFPLYLYI